MRPGSMLTMRPPSATMRVPTAAATAAPRLASPLLLRRHRPRVARTPATGNSSGSTQQAPINAAAARMAEMAREAQRAAERYARDNGLDKKAAEVAEQTKKSAAAASEAAAEQWRTFSFRVEREHGVSQRVGKLRRRVEEALADADAQFGVRRKLRSAADTAKRRWPAVRERASVFLATPTGQAVAVGALVVLIASGALWSLLSVAWVFWWFLIPINLYRAEAQKRQRQEAAAQQAAQQAQRGPWGGAWGGGGGGSGGRSSPSTDRGPVIDAEYTTLWDESSSTGKNK